jgi:hypothetical protein
MAITINYQKRKNNNLFNKLQSNPNISLTNVQNYVPIYSRFFSLNSNNFNSINLNHNWSVSDIKDVNKSDTIDSDNIYMCKLKNMSGDEDFSINQKIFIKMAPLLDPFKYLVGKYNNNDPDLFNMPTIDKSVKVHPKLNDPNNASYVDSFFSYLTSQVLHVHQFVNALDFYGSFMAVKNNYKINVIDDLDYLIQSEFFNKNKNILFKIDDFSHLISDTDDAVVVKPLLKIQNQSSSMKSNISAKSLDDSIFEDIFTPNLVTLDDVKLMNMDLVDITNSIDITDAKKSASLKSGSSCSSRTSHTNDTEDVVTKVSEEDEDELNKGIFENSSINSNKSIYENDSRSSSSSSNSNNSYSSSEFEEEKLMLSFSQFPVQLICLELCENTLDDYIINNEISTEEWFAIFMQIIMTLITYQKLFSFTHNDLHTNNIMYVSTKKKYLYYYYKKKHYKVPTFGKIFKIIDFGRAIYKFNGNVFCSDSFQLGGDAATQYNTEPFFNDKKPRLEPNFSFDLCRLACSIFDYVIDDIEMLKNASECDPIMKLISEWCIDDNGINVLYKNNGAERYPDFKLYKMIARCVHNHSPNAQLERPEFSKFVVSKNNVTKGEPIMNIDEMPTYV